MPNERLIRLIESHWDATQRYRRVLLSSFEENDFELARCEHLLMVDALLRRDAGVGADVLRIALERSRSRFSRHRDLFDQ